MSEGTIAYLITLDNGFRIMFRDSGGVVTDFGKAAMARIGRVDVRFDRDLPLKGGATVGRQTGYPTQKAAKAAASRLARGEIPALAVFRESDRFFISTVYVQKQEPAPVGWQPYHIKDLSKTYILGERAVVLRHALRNATIPVLTVIGLQIGTLLGGAVITESVFAWPGMGKLVVDAIYFRDFPVVQTVLILSATIFVVINLLVDALYTVVDPRIRYR